MVYLSESRGGKKEGWQAIMVLKKKTDVFDGRC